MSLHSPGPYLSFTIKVGVFFFLFLVCKIFHHLLCLGRMFAENISSSLIPIISGGFGSLQAEQQQLTRASQAHRLLVVLVPGKWMSCGPEITSPHLSAREGHWDLSPDGTKLTRS